VSRTDPLHQTSRVWRLYINVVDTPSRLQYQTVLLGVTTVHQRGRHAVEAPVPDGRPGIRQRRSSVKVWTQRRGAAQSSHTLCRNGMIVTRPRDDGRGVLYFTAVPYFNGPLITQTASVLPAVLLGPLNSGYATARSTQLCGEQGGTESSSAKNGPGTLLNHQSFSHALPDCAEIWEADALCVIWAVKW